MGAGGACETLFDDYVAVAEKIGIRRKREQIVFGLALEKLFPWPWAGQANGQSLTLMGPRCAALVLFAAAV